MSAENVSPRDLILPDHLREQLQVISGELVTEYPLEVLEAHPVYAVGDVVTKDLVALGKVPEIAVIDGHTQRGIEAEPIPMEAFERVLMTASAPGTLSATLQRSLWEATQSGGPVLIRVDGEEDLAATWLLANSPDGAKVIYGVPGAGACIASCDAETRARAQAILDAME